MDLAAAAAASSALASTSMSDSGTKTATASPAAGLGSLLKTKDGKFSLSKLAGVVTKQVKATKALKHAEDRTDAVGHVPAR